MNSSFLMGLFAFYVVGISLWRLLADREVSQLMVMKKVWGWREGLALHFVTHVAVPMLFGIVFLSRGVAGFELGIGSESLLSGSELRQQVIAAYSKLPPLSDLSQDISLAYTGEDAASEKFRRDFSARFHRPMETLLIRSSDILLP